MALEITSRDNQSVKDAAKLVSSAKERREKGLFICEGSRLCGEALDNGCDIEQVFFTRGAEKKHDSLIEKLSLAADGRSYVITDEIAAKISDTVTPQGVFVVGRQKDNPLDLETSRADGQYVLLENIQDPSNIGAIFRTAEALGLTGAILTAGGCDPYNPKAMRASMGAVFRLPYCVISDPVETMKMCKKRDMRPMAAIIDGEASKITAIRFFKGVIMCIGNEGSGLSEELKAVCGERVTIPMNGRAESLNAATAAAILMWEMVRYYA